jgi:hypothetical protein
MDRLPSKARLYARQHPLARWHRQRTSGLIAALALRTMLFVGGAGPTVTALRGQIGRSTVTGSPSGIPIRRRFVRMSTTSWPVERTRAMADVCRRGAANWIHSSVGETLHALAAAAAILRSPPCRALPGDRVGDPEAAKYVAVSDRSRSGPANPRSAVDVRRHVCRE